MNKSKTHKYPAKYLKGVFEIIKTCDAIVWKLSHFKEQCRWEVGHIIYFKSMFKIFEH